MATNFEYYKDEILEVIKNGSDPALVNGEMRPCEDTNCMECGFRTRTIGGEITCAAITIIWLYAEHIEQLKLTKKERRLCELVETGWIARDAEGALCWTTEKPEKDEQEKEWYTDGGVFSYIKKEMFGSILPFVQWSDTEPWAVEDLLKLEVEE